MIIHISGTSSHYTLIFSFFFFSFFRSLKCTWDTCLGWMRIEWSKLRNTREMTWKFFWREEFFWLSHIWTVFILSPVIWNKKLILYTRTSAYSPRKYPRYVPDFEFLKILNDHKFFFSSRTFQNYDSFSIWYVNFMIKKKNGKHLATFYLHQLNGVVFFLLLIK